MPPPIKEFTMQNVSKMVVKANENILAVVALTEAENGGGPRSV
jgi:hypothetical protein